MFTSNETRQTDRPTLPSYLHHFLSKLPRLQTPHPGATRSWSNKCLDFLLFMLSSHFSCPHTLPQITIAQGTMKKHKCQYRNPTTAIHKCTKQSCFSCFILSFALWSPGGTQVQKLHTEQNKHPLGRAQVSGDLLTWRSYCQRYKCANSCWHFDRVRALQGARSKALRFRDTSKASAIPDSSASTAEAQ